MVPGSWFTGSFVNSYAKFLHCRLPFTSHLPSTTKTVWRRKSSHSTQKCLSTISLAHLLRSRAHLAWYGCRYYNDWQQSSRLCIRRSVRFVTKRTLLASGIVVSAVTRISCARNVFGMVGSR